MADKTNESQTPLESDATPGLPVTVLKHYVRDLSFENPAAPDSFSPKDGQPDIEISVDVQGRPIEDKDTPNLYEIVLRVRATATTKDLPIFLVELDYATLLTVSTDVPEDKHHPLLFIEIPRFAFPYARQAISSIIAEGGFPPLYLMPVDFYALYMERFKDEIEEAKAKAESTRASS